MRTRSPIAASSASSIVPVSRRKRSSAPIQVYDLAADIAEQNDVAASQPDLAARMSQIMRAARVDNEHWKLTDR